MNKNSETRFFEVIGKKYDGKFFANEDLSLRDAFNTAGILILNRFVSEQALQELKNEAQILKQEAFRSRSSYNAFVAADDAGLPSASARNRRFISTKWCVADDQIPSNSILRTIYNSPTFQTFIANLQGIGAIYQYGDTLSSININYYGPGDSLEWHFDNADFAITLLIQSSDAGGIYEYVPEVRYTADGQEDYATLQKIFDGEIEPKRESVPEGSLMIFRGNRSIHRVTPVTEGERILVTLNYNVQPGVPLSEESRKTFFGRL